jgi:tetratricopeptide (TPR) repeat protein
VSHPVAKINDFKSNPGTIAGTNSTVTESHLLSTSGSGRWQFWGAAISEFRAHPLNGGGAGSWEAWWLQHAPFRLPSEFAHSLYLESLAELGIVGLLLVLGAVLVSIAGAVRSALRLATGEIAAAAACGIAFFAAAAYDWVWQLAGIAIVGVGTLGFALGALPASPARAWKGSGVVRPVLALIAVAAIIPQFVVLAANIHLSNSRAAVGAGDAARARSEALAAKAIEPWASTPYLQLGLVFNAEGSNAAAAEWVDKAISRSRRDWVLWWWAGRIALERGQAGLALRDRAEACRLNPRSQILHCG